MELRVTELVFSGGVPAERRVDTLPVRGFTVGGSSRDYDVLDDDALVMIFPASSFDPADLTNRSQISVVLNWLEDLKELVPAP